MSISDPEATSSSRSRSRRRGHRVGAPDWIAVVVASGLLGLFGTSTAAVDFATRRHADAWLRHPVLGDPSFDAFERLPGNPVLRGAPPLEWPVNGFLFLDPRSGRRYLYVGEYAEGYLARPSRCRLLAETTGGGGWTDLGVVLQGDAAMFDRGGHTPDVSVVYGGGRYHMVYDWGEPDFNAEGGLAYAWADRPEGPWHRASEPITRNSTLPRLLGRYQRTYAATLIRRERDWLIVGMMDSPPNAWAQFVMTAPRPEGPWSERRLVRHVELDGFHPPLLEYYPAFVHRGMLYTPATSVGRNRNFNALFRVSLERATEPEAWSLARCGSLWHAGDVESEAYGLWGQTFSGQVDRDGTLWALFPSRDRSGRGTIGVARRPWNQPLRARGFELSAHKGPTFTCLRRAFPVFELEADLTLRGTARLFWSSGGALGPDRPQSDAVPHGLVVTRQVGLELSGADGRWRVVRVDARGDKRVVASGRVAERVRWDLGLVRAAGGQVRVRLDGAELWSGAVDGDDGGAVGDGAGGGSGVLGWWLEPDSHLGVSRFRVDGRARSASLAYLATEALLGAGERAENWEEQRGGAFRFGTGFVARQPAARVKWNVPGRRFTLWSPRGPRFGMAEVLLDGRVVGTLDLGGEREVASAPVWSGEARGGEVPGHAVVVRALSGVLPVDVLVAEQP